MTSPRDPVVPSQVGYDWTRQWHLQNSVERITVPEKVRLDPYRVGIPSDSRPLVCSMHVRPVRCRIIIDLMFLE